MIVITIFEDYSNELPEFRNHLEALRKLEAVVGKNNFSLSFEGKLQIKHYVGFFQFQNTRIQILPKIFSKRNAQLTKEKETDESLDFIYRLMIESDFSGVKNLHPQKQNTSGEDLLELFIKIFIENFNKQFRRNYHREYIQFEENQSFIKGKILVSETIRKNPILKHRHVTRFDEYSIDNPLNRIFKSLILKLLSITKVARNKQALVTGLSFLHDVTLVHLHASFFDKIKFNRLNKEFEHLFNFAKLFFKNTQPGLGSGSNEVISFLVPLNSLFESYIGTVLQKFNDENILFRYHKPQLYLDKKNKEFRLEPDFTAYVNNKCISILDAKYKNPLKENNVKISTNDLYQLSTYALRYNCKNLILIYPKFVNSSYSQTIMKDFTLSTGMGEILLRVIQIDIREKKKDILVEDLKKALSPILERNPLI